MATRSLLRCVTKLSRLSMEWNLHFPGHPSYFRCFSTPPSKWHGLWEPNDLKLEPDIPEYESINIQMKGYDYPVLESYAKFVHNAMDKIVQIDNECWPVPAKSTQVQLFHPNSTAVTEKYDLQEYERVVCVENISSTTIPLIIHLVQKHVPEGVKVVMKEPDDEEDGERYVPDYDILELQAQRDFIESGKLVKKKIGKS